MIAALLARLQGWLLTAAAVVAVLVGAYALGGRASRRSAELQQAERDLLAARQALKDAERARRVRDDVEQDISKLPAGGAAERLRERYSRD